MILFCKYEFIFTMIHTRSPRLQSVGIKVGRPGTPQRHSQYQPHIDVVCKGETRSYLYT